MTWRMVGQEWIWFTDWGVTPTYAEAAAAELVSAASRPAPYLQLEKADQLSMPEVTPESFVPEDIWHAGAAAYRGGYWAGAQLRVQSGHGRLLFQHRGRTVISIALIVSSSEYVRWMMATREPRRPGYDIRFVYNEGRIWDTWLPDLYEEALEKTEYWLQDQIGFLFPQPYSPEDRVIMAGFGGDGFDWNSPADWAEFGLRSLWFAPVDRSMLGSGR